MFLTLDVLELILYKIINLNDKINFCKIDKELFINNYEKIMKKRIIKFIYNDYNQFYKYLYCFQYDKNELNELFKYSLVHLSSKTIWINRTWGTFDLRYIFELLVNGIDLDLDSIKELHSGYFRLFYNEFKQIIVKNNRTESKLNLLNYKSMYSLQYDFQPFLKNKESIEFVRIN